MQAANSQGSQTGAIDRPHPAAILSHPAAHLKPSTPSSTPLKVLWMGALVSGGLADPGLQLHSKKIFRAFRYRFFLKNHHINKQNEKRMQQ